MNVNAEHVLAVARQYLGVVEATGHNDGAAVHHLQSATGAYDAPWCASSVQTILDEAGVGTYANASASVFYIAEYARQHGDVVGSPLPGRLVCYMVGQGHMGIVERVYSDGSFDALEGNHSNRYERVHRPPLSTNLFIDVPGVVRTPPKPAKVQPPYLAWKAWRLAGADPMERPANWRPAVPTAYFARLAAELKAAKPKPKPAPVKKTWPLPIPAWFWLWAKWRLNGAKPAARPKSAPKSIPAWAWTRLAALQKGRAK